MCPTYHFCNKETGEELELFMSMSEREVFIKENPQLEQEIKTVNIVDPASIGVQRPPADFQKYVLGKVAQMPGANKSAIERRWQIKKEV